MPLLVPLPPRRRKRSTPSAALVEGRRRSTPSAAAAEKALALRILLISIADLSTRSRLWWARILVVRALFVRLLGVHLLGVRLVCGDAVGGRRLHVLTAC